MVIDNTGDSSTAILPITLTANTDYYAQVTMTVDSGYSIYWAGMGFFADTIPPSSGTLSSDNGIVWLIDTEQGNASVLGPGFSTPGGTATGSDVSGADTHTFILDAGATGTGATYSVTDSQGKLDATGTITSAELSSVTGFSLGDNVDAYNTTLTGSFSKLEIGTGPVPTPEPSPTALVLLGFFGLVTLLRFRKTTA